MARSKLLVSLLVLIGVCTLAATSFAKPAAQPKCGLNGDYSFFFWDPAFPVAGVGFFSVQLDPNTKCRSGIVLPGGILNCNIIGIEGGEFVSLLDPPDELRDLAAGCKNVGTWPVLVGEDGQRDAMLSSPIILYDYPKIAPESPGALFDGTEIDEILSLRIMTLTDQEKLEIGSSDERARQILQRTESMPPEQLMKMHGVLRGLRDSQEQLP